MLPGTYTQEGFAIEHQGEIDPNSFSTNETDAMVSLVLRLKAFEPSEFDHWRDCERHDYRCIPVTITIQPRAPGKSQSRREAA